MERERQANNVVGLHGGFESYTFAPARRIGLEEVVVEAVVQEAGI